MVQYRYLEQRGAVGEAAGAPAPATVPRAYRAIPRHILELMPQAVARENLVLALFNHTDFVTAVSQSHNTTPGPTEEETQRQ